MNNDPKDDPTVVDLLILDFFDQLNKSARYAKEHSWPLATAWFKLAACSLDRAAKIDLQDPKLLTETIRPKEEQLRVIWQTALEQATVCIMKGGDTIATRDKIRQLQTTDSFRYYMKQTGFTFQFDENEDERP